MIKNKQLAMAQRLLHRVIAMVGGWYHDRHSTARMEYEWNAKTMLQRSDGLWMDE